MGSDPGPHPGGPIQGNALEVMVRTPATGSVTSTTGEGSGAAPAPVFAPGTQIIHVRLKVHKAEPFSISITAHGADQIKLDLVEVEIFDNGQPIFTTVIKDASPCVLEKAEETKVFNLDEEQIQEIMPHLQIGNMVEVRVTYVPPPGAALRISIIGAH
jgi:hypothetical protein